MSFRCIIISFLVHDVFDSAGLLCLLGEGGHESGFAAFSTFVPEVAEGSPDSSEPKTCFVFGVPDIDASTCHHRHCGYKHQYDYGYDLSCSSVSVHRFFSCTQVHLEKHPCFGLSIHFEQKLTQRLVLEDRELLPVTISQPFRISACVTSRFLLSLCRLS